MLRELDGKEQQEERKKPAVPSLSRLKNIKPKAVRLEGQELVRTSVLPQGGSLPLVMEPATGDVDLPAWLQTNRDLWIQSLLSMARYCCMALLIRPLRDLNRLPRLFVQICTTVNGEHP